MLLAGMALAVLAWRGTIGDVYGLSDWSALPRIMLMASVGFLTDAACIVLAAELFDWIGVRVCGATRRIRSAERRQAGAIGVLVNEFELREIISQGLRWYSWVGSNHRPPVPQTETSLCQACDPLR
jgi:hypothetical protein